MLSLIVASVVLLETPEERELQNDALALTAQRAAPRIRAGIAAAVSLAGGLPVYAYGGGAGLSGELGVVLRDRLALTARLLACSTGLIHTASAGLSVERALSDGMGLSVGLAATGFGTFSAGGATSLAATFPVRVSYAPWRRKDDAIARTGVLLTAELALGATVWNATASEPPTPAVPQFAGSATLSIGYAWW